jgi:hypothetical protein
MLIECTNGPTTQKVGDHAYSFQRDGEGRFVAEVEDLRHIQILLSVEHYRQVSDEAVTKAETVMFSEADVSNLIAELEAKHSAALNAQAEAHALQLKQITDEHTNVLHKARDDARAEALELLATDAGGTTQAAEDGTEQASKTQKKVGK